MPQKTNVSRQVIFNEMSNGCAHEERGRSCQRGTVKGMKETGRQSKRTNTSSIHLRHMENKPSKTPCKNSDPIAVVAEAVAAGFAFSAVTFEKKNADNVIFGSEGKE